MKIKKLSLSILVAFLTIGSINAQILPKTSPKGSVNQIVGATSIDLEYHRPSVRGRQVFGGLLKFGEVWRLGANGCTKITTTDSLFFGENALAPGTYSMFAIPNADSTFTIAFNTDFKQSGTSNYDSKKDVFRLTVDVQSNSFTETLYLGFDDVQHDKANLIMLWANTKLVLPFSLNTNANAISNINAAIEKGADLGKVYEGAGDFYFNRLNDLDQATIYVDKSIALGKTTRNLFLKAKILAKQGKKKAAIQFGKEALESSKLSGSTGYTNYISRTITEW